MECSLKNITVHYEIFGKGQPIIILPGWGFNARGMTNIWESILQNREGWQRIYIDPPGHGKTAGPDWITSQDQILEVVIDTVDKITFGQRFVLIGLSLGAYLARGVIYHRTDLIDGLLLAVPVIFAENTKRTVPSYKVLLEDPELTAGLTQAEAEILDDEQIVIRSQKVLIQLRALVNSEVAEMGDRIFLEKIRQAPEKYAFTFDVDSLSEPFLRPTLILTGRQDSIVGYQDAWQLLHHYQRATYIVIDRAGHALEEKEHLISFLTNEWLDRVEESMVSK